MRLSVAGLTPRPHFDGLGLMPTLRVDAKAHVQLEPMTIALLAFWNRTCTHRLAMRIFSRDGLLVMRGGIQTLALRNNMETL